MNTIIQNILVVIAIILALGFFIKKLFLKNQKSKKECGGGDNCGCH